MRLLQNAKLDKRDTRFESVAPTMSKSIGIAIGTAIGDLAIGLWQIFLETMGLVTTFL